MANCIARCQGNKGGAYRCSPNQATSQIATWTTFIDSWIDKDGNSEIVMKQNGTSFGPFIMPPEKLIAIRKRAVNINEIESYKRYLIDSTKAQNCYSEAFSLVEQAAHDALIVAIGRGVKEFNQKNKGVLKIGKGGSVTWRTLNNGSRFLLGLNSMMDASPNEYSKLTKLEQFTRRVLGNYKSTDFISHGLGSVKAEYDSGRVEEAAKDAKQALKRARRLLQSIRSTKDYKRAVIIQTADKVV